MLTNIFSFENGYLIQLDDILAKRPTPVPPGPTPTVDPIEQVGITITMTDTELLISATGDLSTLDHYEINAYSGEELVKTLNIGKATSFALSQLDKVLDAGIYSIDCLAVSTLDNTSEPSSAVDYAVLPEPAAMTFRFEFSKTAYDPTEAGVGTGGTWTKLATTGKNIWDWTNTSNVWSANFRDAFLPTDNEVSIIATGDMSGLSRTGLLFSCSKYGHPTEKALNNIVYSCDLNLPNCSSVHGTFWGTALRTNPDIETAAGVEATHLFAECHKITKFTLFKHPQFDVCAELFFNCFNVAENVYEMYQLLSSQQPLPSSYVRTLYNCGRDVEGGEDILKRIPYSWGGLDYNN
jgi:hypothetical protein